MSIPKVNWNRNPKRVKPITNIKRQRKYSPFCHRLESKGLVKLPKWVQNTSREPTHFLQHKTTLQLMKKAAVPANGFKSAQPSNLFWIYQPPHNTKKPPPPLTTPLKSLIVTTHSLTHCNSTNVIIHSIIRPNSPFTLFATVGLWANTPCGPTGPPPWPRGWDPAEGMVCRVHVPLATIPLNQSLAGLAARRPNAGDTERLRCFLPPHPPAPLSSPPKEVALLTSSSILFPSALLPRGGPSPWR